VACYDSRGRLVSTTDPLIAGESGVAELTYDGLGRIDRITGPRALAIDWSTGTQIERLHEISADGSGLVSTRWEVVDGAVLDKTVATDDGSATVRYAGSYVLDVADGEVAGTASIQYGLPGGASIVTAPGATATLTIPGTDGSALVRIDVPALGFGASPAPGGPTGVAPAFGPYGEPLVTPSITDASPLPTYSWQAASRLETLPGTASVTIMGDRPYHPALGMFLAADPVIDSGDNLYSYTSGDPINFHDSSGQEESSLVIALSVVAGAALLASFGGGFLLGRSIANNDRVFIGFSKTVTYASIGVAAVAAGGATYLAVKGQTADVAIAIGVAVGTAIVATAGSALLAKWQAARPTRLFKARVAQQLANSSGPDALERAAAVNAPAHIDRSLEEAAMRAMAKVEAVNPKAAKLEFFYIHMDTKTMQRFRDESRRIVARAGGDPTTKVSGKRAFMGAIREVDEALEDAASAL
jgi:RHS repeat-associated protein